MRKTIIYLLISIMIGCIGINQSYADEQPDNKKMIQMYCYTQTHQLSMLARNSASGSKQLLYLLHEEVDDFVPLLFAQSKMENLSIILVSTLVEMTRAGESGVVNKETITMLEYYIEFLKYDLIKTSLFVGMVGEPDGVDDTRNQNIMKEVKKILYISYNFLNDIKESLVDFGS